MKSQTTNQDNLSTDATAIRKDNVDKPSAGGAIDKKKKEFFSGTSPCNSCPYRKDAPLQLWDKYEFEKLLSEDKKQFGGTYLCHKNNGSACKGWLINQRDRNLPNLSLRMMLMKFDPKINYLISLRCKAEMFPGIEEMAEANYPH